MVQREVDGQVLVGVPGQAVAFAVVGLDEPEREAREQQQGGEESGEHGASGIRRAGVGEAEYKPPSPGRVMPRREHDELRIDLERLPEEGLTVSVDRAHAGFAALLDEASDGLDEQDAQPPTGTARFEITPWPGRLDVVGRIDAELPLVCARGLDPYRQPLQTEFSHVLLRTPGAARAEEVELSADDLDRSEFLGTELDLTLILREELQLALPAKPLCTTPCDGPCPNWGDGVQMGEVGQDPKGDDAVDPRWAALAGLKLKS